MFQKGLFANEPKVNLDKRRTAMMEVPKMLNYYEEIVTMPASNSGPYVDRKFKNFILIAQTVDPPETVPGNTNACYLDAIYYNEEFLTHNKCRTMRVNSTYYTTVLVNPSQLVVTEDQIRVSQYSSGPNYTGDWKIIQIELPDSLDLYTKSDLPT